MVVLGWIVGVDIKISFVTGIDDVSVAIGGSFDVTFIHLR